MTEGGPVLLSKRQPKPSMHPTLSGTEQKIQLPENLQKATIRYIAPNDTGSFKA